MPTKRTSTKARGGEAERAAELVTFLRGGEASSSEVHDAFWELDRLPSGVVLDALAPWTGPAPSLDPLDDERRRALGLPQRPLALTVLEVAADADVLMLGDVAEEQLRVAGREWDGQDLDAFERLDGERDDSFAGSLRRVSLAGPGGAARFDVVLVADGAGTVFRAGTLEVVGHVAEGAVEVRDTRTREAIAAALAGGAVATEAPPEGEVDASAEPEAAEPEAEADAPPPKKRRASTRAPAKKSTRAPAKASTRAPAKKKKRTAKS